MSIPAVSIIIPYFGAERFLTETVESVLCQNFRNWELLLVDDGSRDAGPEIAGRFAGQDSRIRLLRHPNGARRGPFDSRLLAARRARAPVIALLDADDLWDSDYLALHLSFWRKHRGKNPGLSFGPAIYWFSWMDSGRGDFIQPMPSLSEKIFEPGELLQNFLSGGYVTAPRTSCSLFRRETLIELVGFSASARSAPTFEDRFLMWGAAARWPVAVHSRSGVRYRQRKRPRDWTRRLLRDEQSFLPAIRRDLERLMPDHPLLSSGGIDARLASLSRRRTAPSFDDYFLGRVPEGLRRLAIARA